MRAILLLLLLDVFLTTFIICCTFMIGVVLVAIFDDEPATAHIMSGLGDIFVHVVRFRHGQRLDAILGVYFYSTFFTSVWIWLYVLSALAASILQRLGGVWVWLRESVLDIDKKPIMSLGWIASMIVTVIFAVLTVVIIWL